MTRAVIPEAERVQREYICDRRTCRAAPGQRCRSRTGRELATSHADRYYKAVADGRLPPPETGGADR
jgi:hypothetical protein